MYTIADLLKSSDINNIRLVAGVGGVENEISRINIMDNPDTVDWLIQGELLLSTGYTFKEGEELQRNVIRQLAEVGCAGLAIKIKRYLACVPQCMIEEAEKLGFPLIELPYGHSLSTVASIVNKHLYMREEARLERAISIHRELTQASLKSGGLREIAKISARYLDNPILIFDSSWRLLRWEDSPKNPHPFDQNISLTRNDLVLPKEFTASMPDLLNMFLKPVTRRLSLKSGQQVICRIMPVGAFDSGLYGFILVWETVHTLNAADYLMLEQVAASVAMERARAREIEAVKSRVRRDFFDDLLSGNIESLSVVRSLAELNGLRLDSHYRCMLVRYMTGTAEDKLMRQNQLNANAERCVSLCCRIAREAGLSVVPISHSFQTTLLLERPKYHETERDDVSRFADEIFRELGTIFDPNALLVVVGVLADDITGIAETFADVQKTARLLRESTTNGAVVFVDDYAVFHLLDKNIDRQCLYQFAQKSLGKLIQYDHENGTQLLQTLDAYFQFSGNISEAAKRMYIHRNTYIYRFDKIKGILNENFATPQKLLEYQIALLAMRIAGEA